MSKQTISRVIHVRPFAAKRMSFPRGTAADAIAAAVEAEKARLRALRPKGLRGDLQTLLDRLPEGRTKKDRLPRYRFWMDLFGDRDRHSIRRSEVQEAIDRLPGSRGTKHHYRSALRRAFVLLDGPDSPNPARGIQLVAEAELPARAVSAVRVAEIFNQMSWSQTKLRLLMVWLLGLRPSEIARLKPESFEEGLVHIRTGKGGHPRTLPLATEEQQRVVAYFLDEGRFGGLSTSSIYKSWKCAQKGVRPFVRPYDLRHCFGTAIYAATGDIRITAELLGHRQLKTSMRYTLGAVQERMRSAMALLSNHSSGYTIGRNRENPCRAEVAQLVEHRTEKQTTELSAVKDKDRK